MGWLLAALLAVPILATLWAIGFGVMAAREKKILWRFLCGLQALVGSIFAAAAWLVFGFAFWEGGKSFAGFQVELPMISPVGAVVLPVLGVLALVLVVRHRRARLHDR